MLNNLDKRDRKCGACLQKKILLNNTVYYIFLSVIFLRHTAYGFPLNKHSKLSHISTINPIINTLTQTWTHGESQTTF